MFYDYDEHNAAISKKNSVIATIKANRKKDDEESAKLLQAIRMQSELLIEFSNSLNVFVETEKNKPPQKTIFVMDKPVLDDDAEAEEGKEEFETLRVIEEEIVVEEAAVAYREVVMEEEKEGLEPIPNSVVDENEEKAEEVQEIAAEEEKEEEVAVPVEIVFANRNGIAKEHRSVVDLDFVVDENETKGYHEDVAAVTLPKKQKEKTEEWAFVETEYALKRRNHTGKDDALFGNVDQSGIVMTGDKFGKGWERMRNKVDQYGTLTAPKWSTLDKKSSSVRSYLPKLAFGGNTQIKLNSGAYYLTMKYEAKVDSANSNHVEAAIIIGEIAFENNGYIMAPNADWNSLFEGKEVADTNEGIDTKWHSTKVSERWLDGDTLKFKIDTKTMTLGFTIQGKDDKDVRAGWMFKNVLQATNNKFNPDFLHVFAYCGGGTGTSDAALYDDVKLTLTKSKRTADQRKEK